jgi:cellulose synthase/poly-beta-1,6-N-acetylglucosamine synthase-like glycosyltransferase
MFFLLTKLYPYFWAVLPYKIRLRLTVLIQRVQEIARTEVPESEVKVFSTDSIATETIRAKNPNLGAIHFIDSNIVEELKPEVSIVTTCLNEADNVESWLNSLCSQSYSPTEVVIVDGGSTDQTIDKIKNWYQEQTAKNRSLFKLKLIVEPGVNIAKGRNLAVSKSKYQLIAFSDFGSVLDSDWLINLLAPICKNSLSGEKPFDVVMGWYLVEIPKIEFTPAVQILVPKLSSIFPDRFLPSGRSLLMTKHAFELAGGYPEYLTLAGEDTLFDFYLKSQPLRFAFVPTAISKWPFPDSLRKLWRMTYNYSRGDGEAAKLFWQHYLNTIGNLFRVCIDLLFLLVFCLLSLSFSQISLILLLQFGFFLMSLINLLKPYRFAWKDKSLIKNFQNQIVVIFTLLAQTSGFIHGVFSRRAVKERINVSDSSNKV